MSDCSRVGQLSNDVCPGGMCQGRRQSGANVLFSCYPYTKLLIALLKPWFHVKMKIILKNFMAAWNHV